jgi:DEAD/DEAH box helicase domain-containing protein
MQQGFEHLVSTGQLNVVERFDVPPRPERRLPIPDSFATGAIGEWLHKHVAPDGSLWRHQSLALAEIDEGSNVVLATGTASGKSLVFQTAVFKELLQGRAKALVLYPMKALLADQLSHWKRLAGSLGLPETTVAELHGQVLPDERIEAVKTARVLTATPDVLQAWFMRQVSAPAFKELMSEIRFLILDEAHVYESVFGSNVAYLIRRFLAARRKVCRDRKLLGPLQIIAASATIADPEDHMKRLTGWPFTAIGEEDDGSPNQGKVLYHVEGPDTGSPGEGMLADILSRVIEKVSKGTFIAFHNSRQGVERIARRINNDDVLPYRSGYEVTDRSKIEQALRLGALRGVISTSALELGIDVAHFRLGLNLGVPQSKKSFRQRLGRVGRTDPSIFAVIAPASAFARYGTTFREYYEGSVEPSHLYLHNRFIQFAQAKCLIDECESLKIEINEPPPGVSWPETFKGIYDVARPGVRKPREFDFIAQLGADSPHINYPLRQVGEANYQLVEGSGNYEKIGDIALNQAIREAYPGALYLHLRRPTKAVEWRATSFERTIRLEGARNLAPTRPILKKTVNVSLNAEDIVGGRLLSSAAGALAEVNIQVNESVEGFSMGGKSLLYRDLRTQDPRMRRKQREFRSTGIVLKINEPWFEGSGPQSSIRQAIADAFKQLLLRDKSISPNDIDSAHTHIAFYVEGAPRRATDTVVIYDSIYGGLRLTEPLFGEFSNFLDMLDKAAELAGSSAFVSSDTVIKLRTWFETLAPGTPAASELPAAASGEYVIFAPGSVVAILHQGALVDRELLEPKLFPVGDTKMLMYRYDTGGRGDAWVPHDQVQKSGQDWHYALWNPESNEIRDVADSNDSF